MSVTEKEKKEPLFKRIKKRMKEIRYQKFVTTFLYLLLFGIILYTFWEYNFVGEAVGPEVYEKTMDTLLGLLGVTGGMKIFEVAGDTVKGVAAMKYGAAEEQSVADSMRGGE